jgi:hypothetical protein
VIIENLAGIASKIGILFIFAGPTLGVLESRLSFPRDRGIPTRRWIVAVTVP